MFPFQPEPMAGTSSHMPWLPFCQAWSIPKFRFTNLWGPNTSVLLMFDITMLLFQPGPMAGISASWSWPLVLQVWCSLIISLAYASGPTIYQRAHVDDSSLWLLTVLAVLLVLTLPLGLTAIESSFLQQIPQFSPVFYFLQKVYSDASFSQLLLALALWLVINLQPGLLAVNYCFCHCLLYTSDAADE